MHKRAYNTTFYEFQIRPPGTLNIFTFIFSDRIANGNFVIVVYKRAMYNHQPIRDYTQEH